VPYLYQSYPPPYVIDAAAAAVKAAIDDAARLGLVWRIIPATVVGRGMSDPMATYVVLDGDTNSGRAVSMTGALRAGQRVWCVQVPPAGMYIMGTIGPSAAIPTTSVFTASGSWTKPTGLGHVRAYGVGGGGQGGGCAATGVGQVAEAAGGSAGGYCESVLGASALAATVTVTIGTGGTGAAAGAAGAAGAASTFGAHWSAGGGGGGGLGAATATNAVADGAAGGAATGGNVINIVGSEGGNGRVINLVHVMMNHGAASRLGAEANGTATSTTGITGRLYGSGGSGSRRTASQAATAGAAGSAGIVIVEEYY
jgi:hypothetical protein